MADTYQITYEYSDGNTVTFKTNDLQVSVNRLEWVDTRVDGTRVVTSTGQAWVIFSFSSVLSGNTLDTLYGVQTGSITFSGAYPRNTTLYWDGDSTETNIEVIMTKLQARDLGNGFWDVSITLEGKNQ
jgi:hypothetical protein